MPNAAQLRRQKSKQRRFKKRRAKRFAKLPGLGQFDALAAGRGNVRQQTAINNQARGSVQSILRPFIRQIEEASQRRSTRGQAAIAGTTSSLQNALGGLASNTGEAFDQAQSGQAAVAQALNQLATGQGSELAGQLGSKLTAAGIPGAEGLAAEQAQIGQGAGAAGFGLAAADLGSLSRQEAGATSFANALPGVAASAGSQQSGFLERDIGARLADQLGQISAQVPGLVSQEANRFRGFELDKAVAREGFRDVDQSRDQSAAEARKTRRANARADKRARDFKRKAERRAFARKSRATIRKDARALLKPVDTGDVDLITGKKQTRQLRYDEAYNRLWRQHRADLREAGISDKQVRNFINGALMNAGFRKPTTKAPPVPSGWVGVGGAG